MNLKVMNLEVQQGFSEIVDEFITRYCRLGTGLNISDRTLFGIIISSSHGEIDSVQRTEDWIGGERL
jgi:hypothetical protein